MAIGSGANFGMLLNWTRPMTTAASGQPAATDPTSRVLDVLGSGIMDLSELLARSRLDRDELVGAVNDLQQQHRVEIFETDGRKFLRLARGASGG